MVGKKKSTKRLKKAKKLGSTKTLQSRIYMKD
jgi:hypothetical protein